MKPVDYNVYWPGWKPATCVEWGCWCEAPRAGHFILEPVNALTNISVIIFGIIILYQTYKKHSDAHIIGHPRYSLIFGIGLIFLGFGSFFFHASRTFAGEWVDVFGMYIISMFFVLINFVKAKKLNEKTFLWAYKIGLFCSAFFIFQFPKLTSIVFGIQLAITFFHARSLQKRIPSDVTSKYLLFALGFFAIGFITWILDRSHIVCYPYAPMNGHGIWHLMNGISAYYVFRFFASDSALDKEIHHETKV